MAIAYRSFREDWTRSLAKAATYRILVVILDAAFVFFLTGRAELALWFVIISNAYTTIAYFAHERFWDSIGWGRGKGKNREAKTRGKKV